jgi:hypothetical protein
VLTSAFRDDCKALATHTCYQKSSIDPILSVEALAGVCGTAAHGEAAMAFVDVSDGRF